MKDTTNPFASEIIEWAYTEGAMEPEQDWDLHLANLGLNKLYIDLASDKSCPNNEYFLSLIYLVVGDAVRKNYVTESKESIIDILEYGKGKQSYYIKLWIERSIHLIQNPNEFNYDDWCAGKLSRKLEN